MPDYDIRSVPLSTVKDLCSKYHGYKGAGNAAVYAFGVYEGETVVAAYCWQPPPPGAAKSVCPEAPQGVLALSRMVAVPREERLLNHVSRPLRHQMKHLIDRGRWPVLVTYSDSSLGHTGHVYKCSGWQPTKRAKRAIYKDFSGKRTSSYSNGKHNRVGLTAEGYAWLQRWEQWVCARGSAAKHMAAHGWKRVPIPGKVYRSGNQAHTYELVTE